MKRTESKTHWSLAKIAAKLGATVKGDPETVITGVATITHAEPGQITFLVNPRYKKYLETTKASAIILSAKEAEVSPIATLISDNPYFTYAKVAEIFDTTQKPSAGIHPTAIVGENCKVDAKASIGPHCVLGNGVQIGAHVILGPGCVIGDATSIGAHTQLAANVTICHGVKIGQHVIIASGTVIGSDGFGLAKHQGAWHKVPQLGGVIIGDNVEIGANVAIDRGAIEDTIIEEGVKLDNLIQVAHNVQIGAHTAIAGCVAIAGSTVIGKHCLIAGGVGITGHVTIADHVAITGMSMVTNSVQKPGVYSSGAGGLVTNLEWKKNTARLHQLDEMARCIIKLERIIAKLSGEKST